MLHGRKAGREMGRHAAKGCRLKSDRLLSILSIFTYCAIKAISQKIIRKKGGPYPFARLSTLLRYLIRVSITDSSKKAGKSLISCGERGGK